MFTFGTSPKSRAPSPICYHRYHSRPHYSYHSRPPCLLFYPPRPFPACSRPGLKFTVFIIIIITLHILFIITVDIVIFIILLSTFLSSLPSTSSPPPCTNPAHPALTARVVSFSAYSMKTLPYLDHSSPCYYRHSPSSPWTPPPFVTGSTPLPSSLAAHPLVVLLLHLRHFSRSCCVLGVGATRMIGADDLVCVRTS